MLAISFADFVYVTKFSDVGLDLPAGCFSNVVRESTKRSAIFFSLWGTVSERLSRLTKAGFRVFYR